MVRYCNCQVVLTWKLLWRPELHRGLPSNSPKNPPLHTSLGTAGPTGRPPYTHTSVGSDPVPLSQNGSSNVQFASEQSHPGNSREKLYATSVLHESFVSVRKFTARSESLVQLEEESRVRSEKNPGPGPSRSMTAPTMIAISTYTTVVIPIARKVPFGMAF